MSNFGTLGSDNGLGVHDVHGRVLDGGAADGELQLLADGVDPDDHPAGDVHLVEPGLEDGVGHLPAGVVDHHTVVGVGEEGDIVVQVPEEKRKLVSIIFKTTLGHSLLSYCNKKEADMKVIV